MTQPVHMAQVAIVIVTYNSRPEIGPCLDALRDAGADIVVVDNASGDGTVQEAQARGARVITNAENRGFAAAVNQGVRATTAPFVLLLNPDAILETGLEHLQRVCETPRIAAAGGCLTGLDGLPQTGFAVRRLPTPAALCFEALLINRIWPHNPVNWRYRCLDIDLRGPDPVPVEQPAGAFFMFRRDAWELLGGFDERFHPLWFEDVDFCRRLKEAGLGVSYVPLARAKHAGAHSIRKIPLERREFYWYGNLLKYAFKHYPPLQRRLVCCSVMAGSVFRFLAGLLAPRGARQFAVCRTVIRLAFRYLGPGTKLEALS